MIAGSPRSKLAAVFKAPDDGQSAMYSSAFAAMRSVQPKVGSMRLASRESLPPDSPRATTLMDAQVNDSAMKNPIKSSRELLSFGP